MPSLKIKDNQIFLLAYILVVVLLLLIETTTYPGFFQHYLGVSFTTIILTSLALQTFVLAYFKSFSQRTVLSIITATSLISLVTVIFFFFENTLYPNVVFSNFHIHPQLLGDIALYLWASLLIVILPQLRTFDKKWTFLFPLLAVGFLFFLSQTSVELFVQIGTENGVVEWGTFLFYILSAVFALIISYRRLPFNKLNSFFFLGMAVVLVVLSGEEIAWGKWILDFSTPDYFLEHNVQQETTLHNLKPVQQVLWYSYIAVGFIGGVLPFTKEKLVAKNTIFDLIPSRLLSMYFLPLLVYGIYRSFIGPVYYKTWEESVELIFSVGVLLYVLLASKNPRKN